MIQLAIVRRALAHIIHDILAFGYVTPKLSIGSIGGPFRDWDAGYSGIFSSKAPRIHQPIGTEIEKSAEVLQHLFSKRGIRPLGENQFFWKPLKERPALKNRCGKKTYTENMSRIVESVSEEPPRSPSKINRWQSSPCFPPHINRFVELAILVTNFCQQPSGFIPQTWGLWNWNPSAWRLPVNSEHRMSESIPSMPTLLRSKGGGGSWRTATWEILNSGPENSHILTIFVEMGSKNGWRYYLVLVSISRYQ